MEKRNIWLEYFGGKAEVDQCDGFGKGWEQGHLSMERRYAQVQVQRGAREPNQRTKTRKPRKRKAAKTRVSHASSTHGT